MRYTELVNDALTNFSMPKALLDSMPHGALNYCARFDAEAGTLTFRFEGHPEDVARKADEIVRAATYGGIGLGDLK